MHYIRVYNADTNMTLDSIVDVLVTPGCVGDSILSVFSPCIVCLIAALNCRRTDRSKWVIFGPSTVNLRICAPFFIQMKDINGLNATTDYPQESVLADMPGVYLKLCDVSGCHVASYDVTAPSFRTTGASLDYSGHSFARFESSSYRQEAMGELCW